MNFIITNYYSNSFAHNIIIIIFQQLGKDY